MCISNIYIYIKWTVFVNVTTKSAQHAHARMIAIIVEKSPNSSHMYDHGFMDNTNRQAVKNWLDSQTRDASLTSFTKWLPPWRKGRISCLWIKSVFDCLTIGIIHETMVVHMTWVWTFFNNYIYIYVYILQELIPGSWPHQWCTLAYWLGHMLWRRDHIETHSAVGEEFFAARINCIYKKEQQQKNHGTCLLSPF